MKNKFKYIPKMAKYSTKRIILTPKKERKYEKDEG
jgi:hypothetical protein